MVTQFWSAKRVTEQPKHCPSAISEHQASPKQCRSAIFEHHDAQKERSSNIFEHQAAPKLGTSVIFGVRSFLLIRKIIASARLSSATEINYTDRFLSIENETVFLFSRVLIGPL